MTDEHKLMDAITPIKDKLSDISERTGVLEATTRFLEREHNDFKTDIHHMNEKMETHHEKLMEKLDSHNEKVLKRVGGNERELSEMASNVGTIKNDVKDTVKNTLRNWFGGFAILAGLIWTGIQIYTHFSPVAGG